MPLADLMSDTVSVEFNADLQPGDMGGGLDDWTPVDGLQELKVSIREMTPLQSSNLISRFVDRQVVLRFFNVRTITNVNLTTQHRLRWDDPTTGRTRYLHMNNPFRRGNRTKPMQWLGVFVEVSE